MRPVGLAVLACFLTVQDLAAAFACTAAGNSALSATSLSTTITVSTHDMVFVTSAANVGGGGCSSTAQTISDSANTWGSSLDQGQPNTFICVTDWFIVNASAVSSITLNLSVGKNVSMEVIRCSGVATSSALDGHSTGTSNALTSPVTTAASIGNSGDLVIGGGGAYDSLTWSAGTGGGGTMTIPSGGTSGGGTAGSPPTSAVEWITATATGTVGIAYTGAAGDGQAILGAAFLPGSGGGGGGGTPVHSGVF